MKRLASVIPVVLGLFSVAPAVNASVVLAVDFQLTGNDALGRTQDGFSSFETGSNQRTFGDYTVTVYQGSGAIGGRDREAITETGSFTQSDLLRDGFTQIKTTSGATPAATNPTGETFMIAGLTAGATYSIQIWSWNKGNDNNLVFAWYDTTVGTGTSASLLGSITNLANAVPTDNNSYSVVATVTASSTGTLSFGQVVTGGSGYINGFVLSQIPEPSAAGFLAGVVVFCGVVMRRRARSA